MFSDRNIPRLTYKGGEKGISTMQTFFQLAGI